jgi:hypothetical protein
MKDSYDKFAAWVGWVIIVCGLVWFCLSAAYGQQNVRIIGDSTGSPIGNSGDALKVSGSFSSSQSGSYTVTPGTGTWSVAGSSVIIQVPIYSPTQFSVTCTGSSGALTAANANRKKLECKPLDANTDVIYLGLGITATTSLFPLSPGDFYVSYSTVVINCITGSGSQVIRCNLFQ